MNEWEIHERIKILESGFEKFTISGAPGRDVQGSFATGFSVNFTQAAKQPAQSSPAPPSDCPPDDAPTHISVSLDYDISTVSCSDGGGVPVDASVSFTDIEGDLAPWTADDGPLGYSGAGNCYSSLLSDDDLLTQTGCPLDDCDASDVDAIWDVFLFFDGTDYWIYAAVYNDTDTEAGICGDTGSYALPAGTDSPFTNIGPSPIGTHTITYTGPSDTATFTIVIS